MTVAVLERACTRTVANQEEYANTRNNVHVLVLVQVVPKSSQNNAEIQRRLSFDKNNGKLFIYTIIDTK